MAREMLAVEELWGKSDFFDVTFLNYIGKLFLVHQGVLDPPILQIACPYAQA